MDETLYQNNSPQTENTEGKGKATAFRILKIVLLSLIALLSCIPFAVLLICHRVEDRKISSKEFLKKEFCYENFSSLTGKSFVYFFLCLITFTCLFPFLWMVLSSVKTGAEVTNTTTLTLFSADPQWKNYVTVFERQNMFKGLLNTLIVEVATIPACVFMSGLSAFAFSKMDLKHKNVHLMIQLSALMIPYACVVLPLYKAYFQLNLTNTLWPLILPSLFGGVSMMFFFIQFQRGIPSAIFEAAKVDGAGYLSQYCVIMLPMMGPAIAAQVIFMFVGTWNDYFAPSLYLTRSNKMTLQIMLKALSDGNKTDLPLAFAGAVIASVPLYVIYLIFQRYFIDGMAISGVKG